MKSDEDRGAKLLRLFIKESLIELLGLFNIKFIDGNTRRTGKPDEMATVTCNADAVYTTIASFQVSVGYNMDEAKFWIDSREPIHVSDPEAKHKLHIQATTDMLRGKLRDLHRDIQNALSDKLTELAEPKNESKYATLPDFIAQCIASRRDEINIIHGLFNADLNARVAFLKGK